jgi:hypothetical protein
MDWRFAIKQMSSKKGTHFFILHSSTTFNLLQNPRSCLITMFWKIIQSSRKDWNTHCGIYVGCYYIVRSVSWLKIYHVLKYSLSQDPIWHQSFESFFFFRLLRWFWNPIYWFKFWNPRPCLCQRTLKKNFNGGNMFCPKTLDPVWQ